MTAATFKKPSPAAVLKAQQEALQQVKGAVKERVETIVVDYTKTVGTLETRKSDLIATAAADKVKAITESEQTVAEKTAAAADALQTYKKALLELEGAESEHQAKVGGLSKAFNQASKDVRAAISAEKKAAQEARKAALAAEKKKVAEAKKAGRSAVIAETKALIDYDVFVVVDTTVRVGHGVAAVGKALKTAFNTGFAQDSGVALPASLSSRQATVETANNNTPQP